MCLPRSVKFLCVCSDTHWFIGWQGSGCKESALEWLHCKTSTQPYIQPLCQRSTITLRVTRKNDVSGLDQTCLTRRALVDFQQKPCVVVFLSSLLLQGQKAHGDFFNTERKIWRSRPQLIEACFFPTITNWHIYVFYKSQALQDVSF